MTRPDNDNPSPKDKPPETPIDRDKFPPFNDPAFTPEPDSPLVDAAEPQPPAPPKDTQYQGHPEFSQDAAKNDPPPTRRQDPGVEK